MRWATTPQEIRHHHDVIGMVTRGAINAIKRNDGSVFIGQVVGGQDRVSPDFRSYAGSFDIDTADGMHYTLDIQDIETAMNVHAQHRAEFIERGIITEVDLP